MGAAIQGDRSALRLASDIESEEVDSGGSTQAAANARQKTVVRQRSRAKL